jgi:hypothetical protein
MAHEDKPWIAAWYRRLGFSCEGRRTLPRDERVLVLRMSLQEQRTF